MDIVASQKEKEKENNKVRRQIETWRTIEGVISGLVRYFKRCENIKDPVLRFNLIVQQISIALDIGLTVGLTHLEGFPHDDFSEANNSKLHEHKMHLSSIVENLRNSSNDFFEKMTEWVATPSYSPDSPYGNNMMKSAEKDYANQNITNTFEHKSEIKNEEFHPEWEKRI